MPENLPEAGLARLSPPADQTPRGYTMNSAELTPVPDPEAATLAVEVANAFGEMVAFYKRAYKVSHEEAVAKAGEDHASNEEHIAKVTPDQVSWIDLSYLSDRR